MHFQPFHSDVPEIKGEWTIDDLVLFNIPGPLEQVERRWTAVKKYSLMVDEIHDRTIQAIKEHLEALPSDKLLSEDALEFASLAEMELDALSDSNSYLVKSTVFLLLVSFTEYANKEVYKLVRPHGPAIPEKSAVSFIRNGLREEGILEADDPASYTEHFFNHIQPVRNNFAHGDWAQLAKTLNQVDLTKSFQAVHEYFGSMKANLSRRGVEV